MNEKKRRKIYEENPCEMCLHQERKLKSKFSSFLSFELSFLFFFLVAYDRFEKKK